MPYSLESEALDLAQMVRDNHKQLQITISPYIKCADSERRSPDRGKEMMFTQNMIQLSTQYAGFAKKKFLIYPLCCQNEAENT